MHLLEFRSFPDLSSEGPELNVPKACTCSHKKDPKFSIALKEPHIWLNPTRLNLNAAMATFATSQAHVLERNLFQLFWPTSRTQDHQLPHILAAKDIPAAARILGLGAAAKKVGWVILVSRIWLVDTALKPWCFPKNFLLFFQGWSQIPFKNTHTISHHSIGIMARLWNDAVPLKKKTHTHIPRLIFQFNDFLKGNFTNTARFKVGSIQTFPCSRDPCHWVPPAFRIASQGLASSLLLSAVETKHDQTKTLQQTSVVGGVEI